MDISTFPVLANIKVARNTTVKMIIKIYREISSFFSPLMTSKKGTLVS